MKTTLILAATLALAVSVAGAASAAPPEKDTSFNSFSFDDTSTCPGITITQKNEERDTTLEFSATQLMIQRHGVATLSANGKTLTSNFSAKIFIDDPNTIRVVGTVYNIQVPGAGTVLLDAGNVAFDLETGEILYVHGPHQQLSGDVAELCSYIAA
jgi:3D (Asp-Asp-Asp) domain-containing protein